MITVEVYSSGASLDRDVHQLGSRYSTFGRQLQHYGEPIGTSGSTKAGSMCQRAMQVTTDDGTDGGEWVSVHKTSELLQSS